MLELLILLNSDVSLYCDTFEMMHRYFYNLYRPFSIVVLYVLLLLVCVPQKLVLLYSGYFSMEFNFENFEFSV